MKTKHLFSITLAIILSFSILMGTALAINTSYLDEAESLNSLGLLKGSDIGYELERTPTRAEAAVMLVRLLGKESTALEQKNTHPFSDVPSWANDYIGYLYANGLTTGIGNNQFGSSNNVSWKDYVTFILRSLGYDDKNGDFTYDTAVNKAISIGLITAQEIASPDTFIRNDMVHLSYNALTTYLNGQSQTLAQQLLNDGVFNLTDGMEAGVIKDTSDPTQAIITLSFSDYFVDSFGHKNHTLKFDRSKLPEAVKDFTKINVSGIYGSSGALDDLGRYNVIQSEMSVKDDILNYLNPYDDAQGMVVTYYDYAVLFFFDAANNMIGLCEYADVQNGDVVAICETLTEKDFEEPEEIEEDVSQFDAIPELAAGYSFTLSDGIAELTIDYDTIIQLLPNAAYCDLSSIDTLDNRTKYILLTSKDGRFVELTADCEPIQTMIQDGKYALITIYDADKNLIAYKVLDKNS